ncbi:MAG: Hsp70 family protein [Beijerinckiaceae bacterium]|nr:Hsp70 family protein [Beijerinckiaceae bacterium]
MSRTPTAASPPSSAGWAARARPASPAAACAPSSSPPFVLRSLIADAEAASGEKIEEAVISVPAYFSDAQRTATRVAGELAGIKVERLINEPTAAALAYGLQAREGGGRFLVFDLGGGTLDVSIIEIFEGVVEVHASAGDNYLGGEDFLQVIVDAAARTLGFDPSALAVGERAQLLRRLEALKIALTGQREVATDLTINGESRRFSMDEPTFASLAEPLVLRLRQPLERALRDANIRPDDLNEVVLVGGATRMPLVSRAVSRLTGRLPLRHIDPDRAIALGAAVAAGMKARDAKLEEIILTDVCPYTLGTDVAKRDQNGTAHLGFLLPIINRNSTVPISREETIWPLTDDQTQLAFNIYQGEHPIADKNVKLGELTVDLARPGPRQERGATIRFTYDVNGILQVEVTVAKTGKRHELILEQRPGVLTKAEIAERLAALASLKVHPRGKQENLAMIARAERLYEEQLDHRERLQAMIVEFRSVLESQDERVIARTRQQLAEALDGIERA